MSREADELVERLLAVLGDAGKAAEQNTPTGTKLEMTLADSIAVGIYWRCFGLYQAAKLLIEDGWAEEAGILGRSLFTDSPRLAALAEADEDERAALALGRALHSLREIDGLILEAHRIGVEDEFERDQGLARVEDSRRALLEYQRQRGIGRTRRFPQDRDLAERFGRAEELLTYGSTHELVHGSDVAISMRRVLQEDVFGHYLRQSDVGVLVEVGQFVVRSLLLAHRSCCSIAGWSDPASWLEPLWQSADELVEAAEAIPEAARYTSRFGGR